MAPVAGVVGGRSMSILRNGETSAVVAAPRIAGQLYEFGADHERSHFECPRLPLADCLRRQLPLLPRIYAARGMLSGALKPPWSAVAPIEPTAALPLSVATLTR